MIFNGRAFAKKIEERLAKDVRTLSRKPAIASILVGEDPASVLYTSLKKKAAERVGIGFEIARLPLGPAEDIQKTIREIGSREDVSGVMVQMPIPQLSREEQSQVLTFLPIDKDVDGLRWEESGIVPATVKAILSILDEIGASASAHYVIVGSHGSVGKPLLHYLRGRGVINISEVNSTTAHPEEIVRRGDVIVSCVGRAGLIYKDMVSDKVIAIDVGISKVDGNVVGDMTHEVYEKAAVAVPVPGGVGPVTVASLLENAVDMCR